jgi:hypothetical protein
MLNSKPKVLSFILIAIMLAAPLGGMLIAQNASAEGAAYIWTAAGDGHIGCPTNLAGERQDALIDRILDDGTMRHFDNGDVSEYWGNDYNIVRAKYDGMGVPYHIAVGNHDYAPFMLTAFDMESPIYTVVDGNIAWVVLNSSAFHTTLDAAQVAYLDEQLTLHSDKLVFILMHIGQWRLGQPNAEVNSVPFLQVLERHQWHIGAVLFSHLHFPGVFELVNVKFIYTGTYGSADENLDELYGYLRFSVTSAGETYSVTSEFINIGTGLPEDEFSVTYTVPMTAPEVYVWDGEGATALASDPLNWVGDELPIPNSMIRYDATSNSDCLWDLSTPLHSFTMETGYGGKVTISENVSIGRGWFAQHGGTLTSHYTYHITCAGDYLQTGGPLTTEVLRLTMTGDDRILSIASGSRLRSLYITGDIALHNNLNMREMIVTGTLRIASGQTVTVVANTAYPAATYPLDNRGEIIGGTLHFRNYNYNGTVAIGSAGDVRLSLTFDAFASHILSLSGDVDCGTLVIDSEHQAYTHTLLLNGHRIQSSGLTGRLAMDKFQQFRYDIDSSAVSLSTYPSWMTWNRYTGVMEGKAVRAGIHTIDATIDGVPRHVVLTVYDVGTPSGFTSLTPEPDYQSTMVYIIVAAAIAFILLVFAFMGRRR